MRHAPRGLIYQDGPLVIQDLRQSPRQWLRTDIEGFESEATLPAVGVRLTLREIYERVEFQTQEAKTCD